MTETKKLSKYSKRFDSNCSFWTKDFKVNEFLYHVYNSMPIKTCG